MAADAPPPKKKRGRGRPAAPGNEDRSGLGLPYLRFRVEHRWQERFKAAVARKVPRSDMSRELRGYVAYYIGETDEIPLRPDPEQDNPEQ